MNDQERIEYFKEQIARLSNQVVDLQNERDALFVYALDAENWFSKHDPFGYISPKQKEAQQALAQIRAEAVNNFAKALLNTVQIPSGSMTRLDYYKAAIRHAIQFANQYAAKVRQGGE